VGPQELKRNPGEISQFVKIFSQPGNLKIQPQTMIKVTLSVTNPCFRGENDAAVSRDSAQEFQII
jgi:hypothetical protein